MTEATFDCFFVVPVKMLAMFAGCIRARLCAMCFVLRAACPKLQRLQCASSHMGGCVSRHSHQAGMPRGPQPRAPWFIGMWAAVGFRVTYCRISVYICR